MITSSRDTPSAHHTDVTSASPTAMSRIWLVAGGGWIGRGVQVAAQLASVRILTDNLGTDGYGAFAVLASLTGWLALTDFSIAISIQNYISERRAVGQTSDDVILSGAMLSLSATVLFTVLILAFGPWLADFILGKFLFLSHSSRLLSFYAMALPGVGTALGNVAYRIWFAQHRGYLSNLFPAAGTILGTAAIWMLTRTGSTSSLALNTLLYYIPLALLPLSALAVIIYKAWRRERPGWSVIVPLLQRSSSFFITGLASAAVLQVDYIIIARVLPPRDIVIYNVASKIFALVFFVYTALLQAIWPVCSEAIIRDDWKAVFSIVRRYLALGIAFAMICGIGFLTVNRWVVALIAPTIQGTIPATVILLFAAYIMVRIWTDTFGMVLQSMSSLRIFWIAVPIQATLSIVLQIWGARAFGIEGVVLGLIACFLLTVGWMLPLVCIRMSKATLSKTEAIT